MVKFWFVGKLFFRQFTSLTYQTSCCCKTKKSCKKYMLLSQPTDVQQWIWQVSSGNLHKSVALAWCNHSENLCGFPDTRNIYSCSSECDWTPKGGPDFCFYMLTNLLIFFSILSASGILTEKKQGRVTSHYYSISSYFCTERFKNKTWVLIIAAEKNLFHVVRS